MALRARLHSPTTDQLCAFLYEKVKVSGLWKLGQCFEDRLHSRTNDASHYDLQFFDCDSAICVAHGITDKARAAELESAGIQYLKHKLSVGVNMKNKQGRELGLTLSRLVLVSFPPIRDLLHSCMLRAPMPARPSYMPTHKSYTQLYSAHPCMQHDSD